MQHDGTTLIDGVTYASRVAPPLTVTGASISGLPLSDWVYILTIIYTLLQTGYFIWKLVHAEKQRMQDKLKEKEDGSE